MPHTRATDENTKARAYRAALRGFNKERTARSTKASYATTGHRERARWTGRTYTAPYANRAVAVHTSALASSVGTAAYHSTSTLAANETTSTTATITVSSLNNTMVSTLSAVKTEVLEATNNSPASQAGTQEAFNPLVAQMAAQGTGMVASQAGAQQASNAPAVTDETVAPFQLDTLPTSGMVAGRRASAHRAAGTNTVPHAARAVGGNDPAMLITQSLSQINDKIEHLRDMGSGDHTIFRQHLRSIEAIIAEIRILIQGLPSHVVDEIEKEMSIALHKMRLHLRHGIVFFGDGSVPGPFCCDDLRAECLYRLDYTDFERCGYTCQMNKAKIASYRLCMALQAAARAFDDKILAVLHEVLDNSRYRCKDRWTLEFLISRCEPSHGLMLAWCEAWPHERRVAMKKKIADDLRMLQ